MPHSTCSCRVARSSAAGVPSHLHPAPIFAGTLVSMADWSCCAPKSPHAPEEAASGFQLIFARAGICSLETRHGRAIVDASTAVLFNAGDTYRVGHPTDDGDASTLIAFDPSVARDVAATRDPSLRDDGRTPFTRSTIVVDPAILLAYRRLRARAIASDTRLSLEERAMSLLADVLASRSVAQNTRVQGVRAHRAHREMAYAVREIVARAPGESHSLASLARSVGASPYHTSRVFREQIGLPIHRYLLRLRLALALERIAGGERSLSVLALSLGFVDQSHFNAAFRAAYATTPARARATLAA